MHQGNVFGPCDLLRTHVSESSTCVELITALETGICRDLEASIRQGISKSGRSGRTSLFQDMVKGAWFFDFMIRSKTLRICQTGAEKTNQYSRLNDNPRLSLHAVPHCVYFVNPSRISNVAAQKHSAAILYASVSGHHRRRVSEIMASIWPNACGRFCTTSKITNG